ncbi:armadillo repeat-containing protein 7-like [Hyalella azteca]|uniref:Armadillo repeat-containing protein 7-like n=1 Tax=Hyalella azteca TaxID=294128 RepID=A0A979FSL9_HYAAZ|nr:armadillo repeat-containing protein 7-like [Hyalella azteca]
MSISLGASLFSISAWALSCTDRRQQLVANLANFGYDPLNFTWLKDAQVVPIFLGILSTPNESLLLKRFAAAGICNLTLAPGIVPHLIECGAPALLLPCLSSSDTHTVLSALTALFYFSQLGQHAAVSVATSLVMPLKESQDSRIRNLAVILLQEIAASSFTST